MNTTLRSLRAHLCTLALSLLPLPALTEETPPPIPTTDHEELARIHTEDQADRQPQDGKRLDGRLMMERDEKRRARVMELYQADAFKTGADYLHAAMVMQHGGSPESYLLAHEFCMAALALGHDRARWLAAASHDRFLKSIGRPQRFGTQYASKLPGGPMELHEVQEGVRDSLRKVLRVPSLADAKAREAEMGKRYGPSTTPRLNLVSFAKDQPPPAGFDTIDLAAGDTPPEIVEQVAPVYPPELSDNPVPGFAIISLVVEPDGTLSQVSVGKTNHEAFGQAAKAAVLGWKIKPGQKQGRPARVIVGTQVYFAPPTAPAAPTN